MTTATLNKTEPVQVLMVEDNMADVFLVEKAFKNSRWPVQLSLAIDGQEAMDCLKGEGLFTSSYRPDIIFLDLSMPKKSGFEVLSEIRSDSGFDNIPVIVLTNSKSEDDMERVYAARANFYLVKPHDFEELSAAIRHVEIGWFDNARHQI
jgi:CheY-like chemotaxis protein